MAKTIYNKIDSHKKQVTQKDDLLVIPGQEGGVKDVVSEINKNLGITHSGPKADPAEFEKAMLADRERYGKTDMSLQDFISWKELKNAQSGNPDFQGQEDGVDVDATQWTDQDVDSGNKTYTNIEQVETDGTPDKDPYLSPEYSEVLSRVEMGKRARTESSLDRKARRELRRDNRRLKRQAAANRRDAIKSGSIERGSMSRRDAINKGYGLDDKQKKILDYTNKNRKAGGTVSGNYDFDSDGNISGQKLENLSGADSKMGIGFTEQVSGNVGGKLHATKENIERYKKQYGSDAVIVDGMIQNPNSNKDQKSSYKMKGYSGYQENPTTPKKEKLMTKIFRGIGKMLSSADEAADVSKVTKKADNVADAGSNTKKFSKNTNTNNNLPAVQGNKLPAKSGEVVPFKGGAGPIKPSGINTGAKISAGAAALGGLFVATNVGSSEAPSENDTQPTVTPPKKTGKSYDQAYKDRDRKVYGHLNKSDYIEEAKRQNEVFKKTGKWDYKNAPKDPGPVSSIKPNKAVSVTAPGTKLEAKTLDTKKVDVDLSALDTRSEVKPNVSKKQEKLGNRIQRLEGRKSTPRRERRINKLQQKQAGVDRGTIRANKVVDKNTQKGFNALQKGNTGQAMRNFSKVNRQVSNNPQVAQNIQQRESELKKAAGFKQKGWAGYQK